MKKEGKLTESQVRIEISKIIDARMRLKEMINTLEDNLESVLIQSNPEICLEKEYSELVPLASELRLNRSEIEEQADRLRYIIERLEL